MFAKDFYLPKDSLTSLVLGAKLEKLNLRDVSKPSYKSFDLLTEDELMEEIIEDNLKNGREA